MSTSGTYSYYPKVNHPHEIFHQMMSDTQMPSFFFGGSQVPVNLHITTGSGLRRKFKNAITKGDTESLHGRGLHTAYEHTDRIMIPKGAKLLRR